MKILLCFIVYVSLCFSCFPFSSVKQNNVVVCERNTDRARLITVLSLLIGNRQSHQAAARSNFVRCVTLNASIESVHRSSL